MTKWLRRIFGVVDPVRGLLEELKKFEGQQVCLSVADCVKEVFYDRDPNDHRIIAAMQTHILIASVDVEGGVVFIYEDGEYKEEWNRDTGKYKYIINKGARPRLIRGDLVTTFELN